VTPTSPRSWSTRPDSSAWKICDGIIRLSRRETDSRTSAVEANRPYGAVIDLWSTSQLFRAGHRIRLDVSSSNFPRFDSNPNTGYASYTPEGREKVVAENTVYFDRERPSYVELPVVPRRRA
jgi:putative CocE/NonD family hydrolase